MFSFIRKNETFLYPRDDTLFLANLILTCAWLYSHRIVAITTQAISSSVWRANLSRPFFVCSPWANKNKEDERGEMEPCKCWSRSFDPGKKFFQSNFLAGIHILLVKRNFSKRSFLEEEKYLAVYPVLATQLGVFVVSPFFPALLVMSLHLHVQSPLFSGLTQEACSFLPDQTRHGVPMGSSLQKIRLRTWRISAHSKIWKGALSMIYHVLWMLASMRGKWLEMSWTATWNAAVGDARCLSSCQHAKRSSRNFSRTSLVHCLERLS